MGKIKKSLLINCFVVKKQSIKSDFLHKYCNCFIDIKDF
jgi:hypothetical protein